MNFEKKNFDNAMTVDVEDAVSIAMRNFYNTNMKPTMRVIENTNRIVDILAEYNAKATFFVLGEVAEEYPDLIKSISNRGHELGIHGYSHTPYSRLTKGEIRDEIRRTKHILEDISGVEVIGHRAPEFSIDRETRWIFEILIDEGLKYDSSVFPVNSNRYGWPGFEKRIDWYAVKKGKKIIEAPLSTINLLGKDIPICGGSYLRLLPYNITNYAFKKVANTKPVNVYIHPYELDIPPFQKFYMDAIRNGSIKSRLKLKSYWYRRETIVLKLRKLLETYKFNSLRNVIAQSLEVNL